MPMPAHGTDVSTRIVVIKIQSRAGQGQLSPMMASEEEWTVTSLGMARGHGGTLSKNMGFGMGKGP